MSPIKKTVLIILLVVIVLLIAVIAIVGIKTCSTVANMQQGAVPIVERPVELAVDATHEPDLIIIPEDEPLDDESFAVDIEPEDTSEPTVNSIYSVDSIDPDVVNILLVGQDSEEYRENGSRTDVMLLLSYNPVKGTLKMLSFMRDSYVSMEGRGNNRLNTCYHFGGMGLLINTLNDTFDLDIQTYVTLAFSEFRTLIDAVGGVDVTLSKQEASFINTWQTTGRVKSGENIHLNGDQALLFARYRGSSGGDYTRTERQRELMTILYEQARSSMTVSTALELIDFASDYVRTNMTLEQMTQLATDLLSNDALTVTTARMPFDGTSKGAKRGGASVIVIDEEENTRLIHEFLYGAE